MLKRELKKGSTELLALSLLEDRARHGYEIRKLIEQRSGGVLKLHVASLYPLLYRMQSRGWIQGRWVEKAGERRRRFYRITAKGRQVLSEQRETWREFVGAIDQVMQKRIYQWRMPRTIKPEEEDARPGPIASFFKWIAEIVSGVFDTIGDLIDKLLKWLNSLGPERDLGRDG